MSSCDYSRREFLQITGLSLAALSFPKWLSAAPLAVAGPIQPVPFTQVRISDAFWAPRIETNRKVTVPYDFEQCEKTGRIDNFAKAGGLMEGEFKGIFYDDSDVYKVIEGASYTLSLQQDPSLEKYLDDLIAKIAAAQEDDGYLYTARTLRPNDPPKGSGPERWSNLKDSHELYNVGHLYEAAVAHFQATGKRSLLDVAIKNANMVDATFGPGKRRDVPGHQEIEIGLVRLYRVTGEQRYLNLAKFFLDQRGRAEGHKLYGAYAQDHIPVTEQAEAVGHAVRAVYMYSGMADVAALTGDDSYLKAIDRLWENVVTRKMYLTGGIGARHSGEAFGDNYELPNRTAYNETCAAIALALWNYRMFLLHGDAKYMDVLERVIYNGFLSGVSLEGNRFFYPNPLESNGKYKFNHGAAERQPWFGTSCCPVNVVRFVPSIAGYVYGTEGDTIYTNLYVGGESTLELGDKRSVKVRQETNYPWEGAVRITVEPANASTFAMKLRIPGWAEGRPAPGDLYRYVDTKSEAWKLSVNGKPVQFQIDRGYATIRREWKNGDVVELSLPMPVRRVVAHPNVKDDEGRVAIERGPIVYCAEAVDNGGKVLNLALQDGTGFRVERRPDLLSGVTVLRGKAKAVRAGKAGQAPRVENADLTLIPYYAWNHRGVGEMAVWLPRDPKMIPAPKPATLASLSVATASYVNGSDSVDALNDQEEPKSSNDSEISRLTWWDHKGTQEWVQYDFKQPATVSAVEVYWFDDGPNGGCRVPASWEVQYRENGSWKSVPGVVMPAVKKDAYNRATFNPVKTDGLRLVVQLQQGFSGGILEWKVE